MPDLSASVRPPAALAALLVLAVVVACDPQTGREAGAAAAGADGDVIRTADPDERGLTEEEFPRVRELADGVYSYEQLRSAGDERFTTVSMFVVTAEGVLVADGQGSVEETRRLVETIGEITDRPITHVVVCSDHGDHTGGNAAFPADAEVLAHPTSERNLRARAERAEDGDRVVLPTEIVDDETVLRLGDREIRVLFLGRAHTGGDLVVHLPGERILFMSEAYLNRIFPAMRSAYPSEWVEMIERAQAMDVDVYVPGHGFVDPPGVLDEELERYRRAVEQVIAEATRLHEEGLELEEAIERADFGELDGWTLRSSQAPRAVERVYLELSGELPAG